MENDFFTLSGEQTWPQHIKLVSRSPAFGIPAPYGRLERKRNKIFTRAPPGEEHFTIIWAKEREKM